ncbi:hypothetical protein EFP50_09250 [Lacticaseibacillus paracasei]|nr:hypothetical protein [Lacticaseibacillus paracasei]MCT3325956.1 hypothetical protein [Lacticaseibacillus paracasei]
MSNETKQDVFEEMKWELIRNLANTIDQNGGLRPMEDATKVGGNYATRYVAALPDNLPVIPKAVGDVIVKLKHKKFSLSGAMSYAAVVSLSPWMTFEHEDTFALAWVLGAWKVEETGEIVKLEEEK